MSPTSVRGRENGTEMTSLPSGDHPRKVCHTELDIPGAAPLPTHAGPRPRDTARNTPSRSRWFLIPVLPDPPTRD